MFGIGRFYHGRKDLLTTDMCKCYHKYIKLPISASHFLSSPLDMVGVCSYSCILCNKKTWKKEFGKNSPLFAPVKTLKYHSPRLGVLTYKEVFLHISGVSPMLSLFVNVLNK